VVDALFWQRFRQSLATLFTHQPNVHVRFFVIRGGHRDDDTALTEQLSHRLATIDATRVEVMPYDTDPRSTLQKIAECDAFVATRLHSGILAYLSGCRLLFIPYHRKVLDLAKEIGLSEQACIPLCDTTNEAFLLTKVTDLLTGTDIYYPTLPVSEALARARLNLEVLERYSPKKSPGLRYAESVSQESV
jgi:polysaccharide pyruvyl transferase WcaK-like protein